MDEKKVYNQASGGAGQADNVEGFIPASETTTGGVDPAYLDLLDDRIQRLTHAANVARCRELREMRESQSSTFHSTSSFAPKRCSTQEPSLNTK